MTYLQHSHRADGSTAPEKIHQETTTTTISTTTTTASSTMPAHTSDSEPAIYNHPSKTSHYSSRANANVSGLKHASHLDMDNSLQRPQNGRSSSLSSSSSSNGQSTLHHKGSLHDLQAKATGTGPGTRPGTASGVNHLHSNGTNPVLSQSSPTSSSSSSSAHASRGGPSVAAGDKTRRPAGPDAVGGEYSSHGAHSWPILFAVIPPLGSLLFGKSDVFSDILTLTLIAFFLYNIIKVPWELYYAARTRRVLLSSAISNAPVDPILEKRRQSAAASLRRQEFFSLLLVLGSPFLGGYTLRYLKNFFSSYEDYLSALNIELFIIASGIRPLTHLISLLKARALHLQEQVHYPDIEVEALRRRVASIEAELSQLRRAYATKRDVLQVQDSVEPTLNQLTKQLKRQDKKETLLRSYTEDRFASIDEKLREYDAVLAYRITEEQHRSSLLFLPINILVAMLGYCTFFLPQRLTGPKQQPMLQPHVPAAIGDGASTESHLQPVSNVNHNHNHNLSNHVGHGHHSQLKSGGRQPSHNPITTSRETARLY